MTMCLREDCPDALKVFKKKLQRNQNHTPNLGEGPNIPATDWERKKNKSFIERKKP